VKLFQKDVKCPPLSNFCSAFSKLKSLQPPRFLGLITHSCLLWKYVLKSKTRYDNSAVKKLKHLIVAAFEKLQHQKCLNVFETRHPVTLISGL